MATPSRRIRLRPAASGASATYGLVTAGAVCTGTMTVVPSMVSALWSDGPAPPLRLATPDDGSPSRTPWDCSSLIRCSVRSIDDEDGFISRAPEFGGFGVGVGGLHGRCRSVVQ